MKVLKTAALTCALLGSAAQAVAYTEAFISLHKTLVEADSATNSEALKTQALKTYLRTNFTVELQTVKRDIQNVFTYPSNSLPLYIPYSCDGNKIWGRGTSDAKGNAAAQITAVKSLIKSSDIVKGEIFLLFVVSEKSGGNSIKAANGFNLTWESVVFSKLTENSLVRAYKGVLGFKITADGVAGHSGYPEYGRRAIDLLVRALEKDCQTRPHPHLSPTQATHRRGDY
ncbi:peptidase M20 domain-containing protein C757.05c [Colletotrichum liriopes]|uniref:Peptidase M20 domain-containing protein C757.05c n=1 Tax=Colletotrichum liriopes TaxID=708192 RepID=A0AA37GYE6_9PEZI|nr:peptidase M20 domain-containing protein C757.05c [Colletotrichum liriopes]